MRTNHRLLFLLGAVTAAGVVSLPGTLSAFSLLPGVSLGLGTTGPGYQRDLRVLNNSAQTNVNSATADPNHPGVVGAALTIWRASDAWGSQTPLAARNFNYDWQGTSLSNPAVGNVCSFDPTTSVCNSGTLAYTLPSSNGWQMFVCENFTWWGGPSSPPGGHFDLQGVIVHELGHALGLGHSATSCGFNCSTHTVMCPDICGNGVQARSLKADDQAGLTAIYGTIPANKPTLTSLSGGIHQPLSQLTINGTNFAATVNVKFTAGSSVNTGVIPGVVYNAPTVGGNSVTVTIPVEAQSGNVLVWEPTLNLLSNPLPITITPCSEPTTYCPPAANSVTPSGAQIDFSGSTSVSTNDGLLLGFGLPNNVTNLFFMGQNQVAPVVFGNGFRCIGAPFYRLPAVSAGIFGDTQFSLDLTNLPQGIQVNAGETWNFQNWYRDPAAGGANFNASEGLTISYCP